MQIDIRHVDETMVIDMIGRLDSSTSGGAYDEMERIAKSGVSKIVLNLDKMEYIGSVRSQRASHTKSRRLRLMAHASRHRLRRLLSMR